MIHAAYEGGFAIPVFGSQCLFRTLMDAMSRPGTIHPVPELAGPPEGIGATVGAILLALCDADTAVWLNPELARNTEIRDWIAFHAGAPAVVFFASRSAWFVNGGCADFVIVSHCVLRLGLS